MQLILIIYLFLFSLYIFEHIFALREHHVVREHLGVLIVEAAQLRQPHCGLLLVVGPFEELVNVVKDEVVLENRDHMGVLVVDEVVNYFNVVVVPVGAVLFA